jgi:hypothetical protein
MREQEVQWKHDIRIIYLSHGFKLSERYRLCYLNKLTLHPELNILAFQFQQTVHL